MAYCLCGAKLRKNSQSCKEWKKNHSRRTKIRSATAIQFSEELSAEEGTQVQTANKGAQYNIAQLNAYFAVNSSWIESQGKLEQTREYNLRM